MRHLKVLGLASLGVVALIALFGAGSAPATVLCKTTENPCPAGSKVAAGTEVDASLPLGVESIFDSTDEEIIKLWCTESTISFTTENAGSAFEPVKAKVTKWSWGGCTTTKKLVTLKTGQFEIDYIAGTGTGTVTGKGFEFTAETIFGADCIYGVQESPLDFGRLNEPSKGETQSQIEMEVAMPKLSGGIGCPAEGRIRARYLIPSPAPLYVSGS